ncbi:nucleotide-binding universal stress UspA family protein [Kribbella voronezhensis]|uniref:Nucleotide-binding universal stress UspA family protein n=1 Tax=Kribbella voronezhensis TaxID=2512212 RepID=A0A4R7SWQ3_9ACTN|nr:universal stress protein [Kribbella voronezhensis]TDU83790.1 nucleotide-binding universal stress UspA family protein [Kribbella voronezhensis]
MSAHARPAIVVGIDGSADGLHALYWAVELATRRGWTVRALHVVDEDRPARPLTAEADHDDGTDVLDDAADELERIGFTDAVLEVGYGHPAQALLKASHDAAALVIGRRGAGGFAELTLGSTSQVCAALAGTTLVVVPDTWRPDTPAQGQIVVGVDGSHSCQAALGFAFEIAAERGAELTLLHVPEVPETFPRPDLWVDPEDASWHRDARALVGEALSGWPDKYPDVIFRTRYPIGHPVQVLAKESEYADLVVVGGRGRTEFTELRLGSVSRGLLHHARCPVAIVHSEVAR